MGFQDFKSSHNLAVASIICLSAISVFYFLDIIYNIVFLAFFPDFGTSSHGLTPAESMMSLLALAIIAGKFIAYVATIIFFLMWLHRSYKNLEAFNVRNLEATPGWAVGYWFIPILNLFKPLKVVNEVFHGSSSENVENDFSFANNSTPMLNGFWWAFWLASNFISRIVATLEKVNKDVTNSSILLYVVALSFGIMAGVLLIFIIREIDQRQIEAEKKLSILTPPMPPTFNQT